MYGNETGVIILLLATESDLFEKLGWPLKGPGFFWFFLFFIFFLVFFQSLFFFGFRGVSSLFLLPSSSSLYLSPSSSSFLSSSTLSIVVARPLPGLLMATRREDLRAVLAVTMVFCSWGSSSRGSSGRLNLARPLALPTPHNRTASPTPLLPLPRRLLRTTLVTCPLLMGVILL